VNLVLKNLTKSYNRFKAIDNLSLEIPDKSLFTLLGPSGCGKTTTLRSIAGFIIPEDGHIYYGDKEVTRMRPDYRNTGMVFQDYALFPHLSINDNVAYGLKARKVNRSEIDKKIETILEKVGLSKQGDKFPNKLSGGQQQRVAMARALVIEPDVLLMDEPLSNLDAKLRIDMRAMLKQLQKDAGITTVFVTHDQEEAMSISDYIAVMNNGHIQQVGTPV